MQPLPMDTISHDSNHALAYRPNTKSTVPLMYDLA
ncbi:hypothetical protein PF003_g3790 [Phytophthora fragariae]|nr:hypothetical protein PF003_g3790 [Phytophthora fragariae]